MNYNIQIQKENSEDKKLSIKDYQYRSLVKVFITNETYKKFSFDPSLKSLKEIKWANRLTTNKYIPIKVELGIVHNGIGIPRIKRLKDETHNDGYAVISKKHYRLKNTGDIFITGDKLLPKLEAEVDRSLNEYNTLLEGNVFSCNFEWERSEDIAPRKKYSYNRIIASTPRELQHKIQEELDFLDDEFDEKLGVACREAFKE